MNLDWDRTKAIFAACVKIPTGRRDAYLQQVCGDNIQLRHRILQLLAADRENQRSNFLDWSEDQDLGGERIVEDGERIGDFEVVGELGRGATGAVVLAQRVDDPNFKVAIKLLRIWQRDTDGIARFQKEAEALARLNHPKIAKLVDTGVHQGCPYIVTQFVAGKPLNEHLKERQYPIRTRIGWFLDICHGVAAAHEAQTIHRDLKPSNIIIAEDGTAVVTDFGLAKFLNADIHQAKLTATGQGLGTPGFMAPEQIAARPILGLTTDVYGLGAVLYYLLTGKAPFDSENVFSAADDVRWKVPADPRKLNSAVERDLSTICLHCLKKEPSQRYQSVSELIADVHRWRADEPILVRPLSIAQKTAYWGKKNPALAILSVLTLLTLMASLVLTTSAWRQAARKSEDLLQMIQSLTELEKGYRDDPAKLEYRRDLLRQIANEFERMGTALSLDSDLLEASATAWLNLAVSNANFNRGYATREYLDKAIEQFGELARRHPENSKFRFDLFHCYDQAQEYDRSFEIISQLVSADTSGNLDFRDCLSHACLRKGMDCLNDGELKAALDYFSLGESISAGVVGDSPPERKLFFEKNVMLHRRERARVYLASGQVEPARSDLEIANEIGQRFHLEMPEGSKAEMELCNGLVRQSCLDIFEGNFNAAKNLLDEADVMTADVWPLRKSDQFAWNGRALVLMHQWMLAMESGDEETVAAKDQEVRQLFSQWSSTDLNQQTRCMYEVQYLLNQASLKDRQATIALADQMGPYKPIEMARTKLLNGDLTEARAILKASDSAVFSFREVPYLRLLDAIESGEELDIETLKPSRESLLKSTAFDFYHTVFLFNHLDREIDAIRIALDR